MEEFSWAGMPAIVEPLLAWYDRAARVLPWRSNPTPYFVWISEIMLQQTRVEAVKPYFDRFVREIPNIAALSAVEDGALMKIWQGLGYYSRARNLKKAAQGIMTGHDGVFPGTYEAIRALPGIGDYTAGAIASIAFGLPVSAVDGNVLRVFARLLGSGVNIAQPATKKLFAAGIRRLIPPDRPGDFNQALMELGATVCLPNGQPKCGVCPLSGHCRGYELGIAETLPVKPPKKPRRQETLTVLIIKDPAGRVALRQRPEKGLLAGMWEYPHVPEYLTADQTARQLKLWRLGEAEITELPAAKHVFTHVEWHMVGYKARLFTPAPVLPGWVWCSVDELREKYAIPSAFRAYTGALRLS